MKSNIKTEKQNLVFIGFSENRVYKKLSMLIKKANLITLRHRTKEKSLQLILARRLKMSRTVDFSLLKNNVTFKTVSVSLSEDLNVHYCIELKVLILRGFRKVRKRDFTKNCQYC